MYLCSAFSSAVRAGSNRTDVSATAALSCRAEFDGTTESRDRLPGVPESAGGGA